MDFTHEVIEKLLVKKVLTEKKYMNILSNIFDKRWFDVENYGVIMKLAITYFRKYDIIPSRHVVKALCEKYADKYGLDFKLLNADLSSVYEFDFNLPDEVLKSNIKNFIEEKALYYAISDNSDDIMKHHNVDKCLNRFRDIQKMSFEDIDIGSDYFNSDDMEKHWEFIRNPEAKIKTLWPGLDQITNGGFFKQGKSLYCIMAQAGLGKSLFLSNLAVNFLKQNLKVVVISLEMSRDEYAKRFDSHISQDDINMLNITYQSSMEKIRNFYNEHPEARLIIQEYPPRSVKTTDIEMYLDNLVASDIKFDVIIVDYLNLILSNNRSEGMYQQVLNVAEKLRAMSYKYGVPVVTATQANGEGMNNENIGMEHVSESKGIAHTVDFLAALWQLDEERAQGIINMRILKNRLGGRVSNLIKFKQNSHNLILEDTSFSPNQEVEPSAPLANIDEETMSLADSIGDI